MIFNKLLFMVFVIFLASCSEKKLSLFECKEKSLAESCSEKCEKNKRMHYTFLVNEKEKTVMQKVYYDEKIRGSILYEQCKIFNINNWDCSKISAFSEITLENDIKMIDGIYSDITIHRERTTFIDRSQGEKGFCAK